MNLDEVTKKYAVVWVACRVLKRDENGQPTDFEVVDFSPDRTTIRQKVAAGE